MNNDHKNLTQNLNHKTLFYIINKLLQVSLVTYSFPTEKLITK